MWKSHGFPPGQWTTNGWFSTSMSVYWRVSISHNMAITHHQCSQSPFGWAARARSPPKRRFHDLGFQACTCEGESILRCLSNIKPYQASEGATWITWCLWNPQVISHQGRNSQIAPGGTAPEPLPRPPRGSLRDDGNLRIIIYTYQ